MKPQFPHFDHISLYIFLLLKQFDPRIMKNVLTPIVFPNQLKLKFSAFISNFPFFFFTLILTLGNQVMEIW